MWRTAHLVIAAPPTLPPARCLHLHACGRHATRLRTRHSASALSWALRVCDSRSPTQANTGNAFTGKHPEGEGGRTSTSGAGGVLSGGELSPSANGYHVYTTPSTTPTLPQSKLTASAPTPRDGSWKQLDGSSRKGESANANSSSEVAPAGRSARRACEGHAAAAVEVRAGGPPDAAAAAPRP
jgi:hypothetical protein